jgi:hypothetical protein
MVERTKKTFTRRQIYPMPCPEEYAHRLQNMAISGHYGWMKQLIELKDQQTKLQPYKKCNIPQIEEDQIVLYAVVEKRHQGFMKTGSFKHIFSKWKPSIKDNKRALSKAVLRVVCKINYFEQPSKSEFGKVSTELCRTAKQKLTN